MTRALLRTSAVAGTCLLVSACGDDPSALDPRGRGAREVAVLWWVMFAAGTAVMALVTVLLLRVAWRRDRSSEAEERSRDDEARAERASRRWVLLGGVVLPAVVIVPISVLTLVTGERLNGPARDDAVEVELTGVQFWWDVHYPETGATTANEIHLPVGRDAHITLTSRDVIHSFWVPSLHGKVDLVPGETTEIVIEADEPGVYRALCAEFCGIQHAHMKMLVVVHTPEDFETWMRNESSDARSPSSATAQRGAEVFRAVGCASCHTVRGTDASGAVGPDLTHLAARRTLGAATIENNRGNLGGWIANPQRIKPGNAMPPTVLEANELLALIAYLESLE